MEKLRIASVILFAVLIMLIGRESQAVIYKYVNEKGVPIFTDDMQKIPEQYRASAVMVAGVVADEKAEQEKARLAAEAADRQELQSAASAKADETLKARLIRSGVAIGLFIALLFVASHIDVLKEQAQVLFRIRSVLTALLLVFLAFTHARDVMGLFEKVGDRVSNPVASIQEKSAERGRKAAQAYKSMEQILEQRVQDEETRAKEIERTFDEAERGK